MQTPITGGTFAFPTFHFNLNEHSVDCAKRETRTKILNAAGFALSRCLENCKLKS